MKSRVASQIYRINKEAGRPFPTLSEDDYIDYCVLEAVAMKVAKEDAADRKKQEREQWKKDRKHLKQK